MLPPEYLLHAVEPAEEIAEQLHQDIMTRIIERIKKRFERGDDYILTSTDKWNIETLQQAGYLLEDIQNEIAKATGYMQTEIAEAMEDAGVRALEYDDEVYRAAGLNPIPLVQSPQMIRLMQRDYEATFGEWRNFTGTTAEAVQQTFIRLCDKAYHQAMAGVISPSQAVKEALEEIIESGVYVDYPTGHRDTIETATTRAVRTGISQASGHITDARLEEMDWDIILVSSHLGARVNERQDFTNHYWWQGKFYSKSGKDPRFPPFSVCGMGDVQGIHGANCRHSHGPGDGINNPFEKYDSEENRRQYELDQRQRTMERRIRKTKRQVMDYQTAGNQEAYERKAALLQKQNKAYNDFCAEHGLKKRADRISIAKWNRSEAAKARAAAKKYAADHPDSVVPKEYKPRPKKIEMNPPQEKIRDAGDLKQLETTVAEITKAKVDFSGTELELMKENMVQLVTLGEEYGYRFSEITTTGAKKYLGEVTRKGRSGDIVTMQYPKAYYKSRQSLLSALRESSSNGDMPRIPGRSVSIYTTTHEFAHTLSEELTSRLYGYGKELDFWDEIETVYTAYKQSDETVLGKYARKNQNEFLAEAFAYGKLGNQHSEYADHVVEIVDKYFKRGKHD